MYDTVIIGGGPAGLQAALTLGRVHRTAVLFDSGEYRNDATAYAHNVLTLDGVAPGELRRRGREELAAYDSIEVRGDAVTSVRREGDGFAVTLASGSTVTARTVILATGLADTLPDIPGLAAQWGDRVAHCAFCHGHEFAGRPVAVMDAPSPATMTAAKLRPIASDVRILAPGELARVEETPDGLRLHLADGTDLEVAGLFAAPRTAQRAPFAAELGLALTEFGVVATDGLGRTSMDGVWAVGDMAQSSAWPAPLTSIVLSMSTGQLAAFDIVQGLAVAELSRDAG
ncbi:NAD(P)/FAD-dependent oxidoreductase [Microbacterium lushaniae]|nr:NAD(P)/FAD-dependent oxidoreductase [Microbacterium lushaniae]KAA9154648.1 NAD(P)/FAD-dependent oxidoreductase [Microbacterium lushaniae]